MAGSLSLATTTIRAGKLVLRFGSVINALDFAAIETVTFSAEGLPALAFEGLAAAGLLLLRLGKTRIQFFRRDELGTPVLGP